MCDILKFTTLQISTFLSQDGRIPDLLLPVPAADITPTTAPITANVPPNVSPSTSTEEETIPAVEEEMCYICDDSDMRDANGLIRNVFNRVFKRCWMKACKKQFAVDLNPGVFFGTFICHHVVLGNLRNSDLVCLVCPACYEINKGRPFVEINEVDLNAK